MPFLKISAREFTLLWNRVVYDRCFRFYFSVFSFLLVSLPYFLTRWTAIWTLFSVVSENVVKVGLSSLIYKKSNRQQIISIQRYFLIQFNAKTNLLEFAYKVLPLDEKYSLRTGYWRSKRWANFRRRMFAQRFFLQEPVRRLWSELFIKGNSL